MKFPYIKIAAITEQIEPGFYQIDNDAYHAGPGLSSTKVKKALDSYSAFHHPKQSDSPAMAFGRAFHAAALEPELFEQSYTVMPDWPENKNSNAYKAKKEVWLAENRGKEVLTAEAAAQIKCMVKSLTQHPKWAVYQDGNDPEIMAVTRCKITGQLLKCKSDLFGHRVLDLKSTSYSASEADFLSAVATFGYHISAAFYSDIIQELTGQPVEFIGVPVMKEYPYECEFYRYTPELLQQGRLLYQAALRRIARWQKQTDDERIAAEKQVRDITPSARIIAQTQQILKFIGE